MEFTYVYIARMRAWVKNQIIVGWSRYLDFRSDLPSLTCFAKQGDAMASFPWVGGARVVETPRYSVAAHDYLLEVPALPHSLPPPHACIRIFTFIFCYFICLLARSHALCGLFHRSTCIHEVAGRLVEYWVISSSCMCTRF